MISVTLIVVAVTGIAVVIEYRKYNDIKIKRKQKKTFTTYLKETYIVRKKQTNSIKEIDNHLEKINDIIEETNKEI